MNNIFIRSLPVVAMAMGDKMGVQVRIEGNQAMTDGKTIILPVLPEGDESAWVLARGYLDHEAGHVRHTDFSISEKIPLLKTLANIIEDIRVEQAMGAAYPGCAVNLRNLATLLAGQGSFTPSPHKPEELLLGWILAHGRGRVLRQGALDPVAGQARDRLVKKIGVELVREIEVLLPQMAQLASTRQAHDLARDILEKLKCAMKQAPPPETGGQEKDNSAFPSTTNGNGNDTPEGTGTQAPALGAIRDQLERMLRNDPGSFGDLGQLAAEAMHSASDEALRADPQNVEAGLYPGEQPAKEVVFGQAPSLALVRHETVALRSRLAGLVQSFRQQRVGHSRLGTQIDHRVLHRLPIGDTRVFRRTEEKTAVNTAVIILLDRSGSMRGERIELARKTVLALTDALAAIPGVSAAGAAFPGTDNRVIPLTPFGSTAAASQKNYGIGADGGTPLAHALGWARAQMAVRREPRKILLVATDGAPSSPELVRTMLAKLEAEGIELMGLGIMDQGAAGKFFPRHRTVQQLRLLPAMVFEMFQEALIGK